MHKRFLAVPVAALAGLAVAAGLGGPAAAAPLTAGSAVSAVAGVSAPAASNGWHMVYTFPLTSDGLAGCLANVNYYTNNPQYPEVRRAECRNGPNRYEFWWYIDA